jgi:hypothetical protein
LTSWIRIRIPNLDPADPIIKADPDPQHCFPRCGISVLFIDQDENTEPSTGPQKGEKRGLKKPTQIIKGRDILSLLTNK